MENDVLRAKINGETAKMPWEEISRFFASGAMVYVSTKLDLVDTAFAFANDDKAAVGQWMDKGLMGLVSDEQASAWHENDATLWTVIVKPWILVQEPTAETEKTLN